MSHYLHIIDCTLNPVTTSAYSEIVASISDSCSFVQFFYFKTDASFGLCSLAIGAPGEEEDHIACSQKVGTPINFYASSGERLSVKAIGSDITTGYIILCLLP